MCEHYSREDKEGMTLNTFNKIQSEDYKLYVHG